MRAESACLRRLIILPVSLLPQQPHQRMPSVEPVRDKKKKSSIIPCQTTCEGWAQGTALSVPSTIRLSHLTNGCFLGTHTKSQLAERLGALPIIGHRTTLPLTPQHLILLCEACQLWYMWYSTCFACFL